MPENNSCQSADRWRQALLPADATVQDAIRCLNDTALQIALVIAPNGALVGTVTDGDIRRGLLQGFDLSSPIDAILFKDPIVVPPHWPYDAVLQLMQVNKIRQLPVVDEARRVVGLHLRDELLTPSRRENLIVIMAGGRGTRLLPHTENCPKPLLPIAGKPILEHIVERAKAAGFSSFVLAVHYLGHIIEKHFGDGSRWQVRIEYLREQKPLGTAGALALLNPRPHLPFVITNGDVITDIHYGEMLDFHCRHGAAATMAVRLHQWQHPFGVVHTSGVEIVGFEEKPIARSHINAGVYVLEPSSLEVISVGESYDMPALFGDLREQRKRTIVYPMHEPWLDVGQPEDYDHANGHTGTATPQS